MEAQAPKETGRYTRRTTAPNVRARAVLAFSIANVFLGCADSATDVRPTEALAPYVTGSARSALDGGGRFVLPVAGGDTLTKGEATALTEAFVRRFGPLLESAWSEQSGVPIRVANLQVCSRPFLTRRHYADSSARPVVIERALGPHWVMSLCESASGATVTVSVNALARELVSRDLSVVADVGVGDFQAYAYPPGARRFPVDPEEAAIVAAKATGARVASVPVLIQPNPSRAPSFSYWRVEVERQVAVRGVDDASWRSESAFFVALDGPRAVVQLSRARVVIDNGPQSFDQRVFVHWGLRPLVGLPAAVEAVAEVHP